MNPGDQEDVFLTKSKDKFTVKGVRILNRLLRKHAKLEPRTMIGNVVQFRPSGIRFSDSETSPALVAIGQIPFLVEKLTNNGVYKLSTRQAAYLQGIDLEKPEFKNFKNMFSQSEKQLTTNEQFMRLGNAVNVELVRRIVYQFNEVARRYQKQNLGQYCSRTSSVVVLAISVGAAIHILSRSARNAIVSST